jgi:endonuclease/exonuclease/phosphatase family metal-dependent hydrolase
MSFFKSRLLWIIAIVAGMGYASQHYTIGGWQHLRLVPSGASNPNAIGTPADRADARGRSAWAPTQWVSAPSMSESLVPRSSTRPTHRLATLNLQAFGDAKANKVAVMEILALMLRNFDVIAIQDIHGHQRDALPRLVDQLNQTQRHFDYCIGPRVGDGLTSMHFAFLYDSDRIDVDRYQLYTVEDPMNHLEYEPLVGWFRSRLVPEEEAFTFSMVNLRINPQNAEREVKLLPDLIRSVLNDGRNEDDILLAGDFGCGDSKMESLRRMGMSFALSGVTTTVAGDEMLDNILFPDRATDEYKGRSGTIDFLRQFNLTPDQALQVSNHMPVWAEFSAEEGGVPGYTPH